MGATEASGATPARASARASADSKSSMPCNLLRSEKSSRMESVVNKGSSRRAVSSLLKWSKSRCSAASGVHEALYLQCNISLYWWPLYAPPSLRANDAIESRDLIYRAVGLINGRIGVRERFRVRICNRDAPKGLAADDAGL